MLRQDDFTSAMLVLEAWRQGESQGGHQAALLIMNCIMNRLKKGWAGGLLEVLESVPKYSATLEQPFKDKFPGVWSPGFVKLLHEVDGVKAGSSPDVAKSCLYWADLSQPVTNPWFQSKILDNKVDHRPVVTLGPLYLFQ